MPIQAVLWDLDGTLVDSEDFHWRAWKETLEGEGVPITHQDFLASFGQRNDAILPKWLGPRSSPERNERIANAKEARYRDLVCAEGLVALAGAEQWVDSLHREGWRQAVASSAPRLNVETVLDALHLRTRFEATVTAEDVHLGKPHPEVFLVAAERLGVHPAHCVVVEDAAAGVEAGLRAGMRVIAVGKSAASLGAHLATPLLSALPVNAFRALLGSET